MSHHGQHGYPITKQMRIERRKRAETIQKEYDTKYPTLQSKLNALPPAPACERQRTRLLKQIEAEKAKPAVEKVKKAISAGLKDIEDGNTSSHEEVKTKLYRKYMRGAVE